MSAASSAGTNGARPAAAVRSRAPRRRPGRAIALGVAAALLAGAAVAAYRLAFARAPDATTAMARGRYADAAHHYALAAEAGDPAAMTALGNLHYLGLGTPTDPRRAAELYFAAARTGHADAQLNLGNLYSQGLGVPADPLRAFGWYMTADRYGQPAAEYYLTQISLEYTLSPLQQSTAAERWRSLELLVAEGL